MTDRFLSLKKSKDNNKIRNISPFLKLDLPNFACQAKLDFKGIETKEHEA